LWLAALTGLVALPSAFDAIPRPTDHRDTDLQIGTARR
jgi:hypothetical protein